MEGNFIFRVFYSGFQHVLQRVPALLDILVKCVFGLAVTCIGKRRWVGRVLEYFWGLDHNYVGCNPNWPRNWAKWPQKAVILGHL